MPPSIQNQLLSHICLKFRTDGLKQQDTLSSLPKAIRSSISHHLFFPIIQNARLFQGLSHDNLFQLVFLFLSYTSYYNSINIILEHLYAIKHSMSYSNLRVEFFLIIITNTSPLPPSLLPPHTHTDVCHTYKIIRSNRKMLHLNKGY